MKIRTWNYDPYGKHFSNAGNGHAIPQLELDENKMVLVPKLDAKGKQVTKDLYSDIQKWAEVNSLERIMALGDPAQIELLNTTGENAKEVDYTQISDTQKLAEFQNKLNSKNMTLDQYLDATKQIILAQQELLKKQKELTTKKDVKENEKDKK